MNIIQDLAEKYNGQYSEDFTKEINSPFGKFIYQPKKGTIIIDGTKISINLNEVGGAMPVTEPFRIILHLNETYETELMLFPKGLWNKILDFILPERRTFIPKRISQQFWLDGDQNLIKQLVLDKTFIENIIDERVYIKTGKKPTNQIVLTPEYGVKDISQFEKFVAILKLIEEKIYT